MYVKALRGQASLPVMAYHSCWHVAALATAWVLAATCVLAQSSGDTGSCSPYGPRKDCGAPASISACMHVSGGRLRHDAGGEACCIATVCELLTRAGRWPLGACARGRRAHSRVPSVSRQ